MYWPVAKEISFKDISIFDKVAMLFSWANILIDFGRRQTICAIMIVGIMPNMSVK